MTPRRIVLLGLGLLGSVAAAFVAANAIDYQRFHGAVRRVESLSEAQFRALGDAAMAWSTNPARPGRIEGFDVLGAIKESGSPGNADFLLYQLKPTRPRFEGDDIYLYVRISTSPNNQEIIYFTNSGGEQQTKVLWNRNPEFVKKHSPSGRLLTITQWGRDSLSWMVLPDRILVVADNGRVGGEPSIVGTVAINSVKFDRIKAELDKLPASLKGKDYRAENVADGIALSIRFDSEGKAGPDDIFISNTWVEEFRPLLALVSESGPKDCPIRFIEYMTTSEHLKDYPTTTRSLAERKKMEWPEINAPWWCVWRKWLG